MLVRLATCPYTSHKCRIGERAQTHTPKAAKTATPIPKQQRLPHRSQSSKDCHTDQLLPLKVASGLLHHIASHSSTWVPEGTSVRPCDICLRHNKTERQAISMRTHKSQSSKDCHTNQLLPLKVASGLLHHIAARGFQKGPAYSRVIFVSGTTKQSGKQSACAHTLRHVPHTNNPKAE
jgi:hypothetical protein